MKCEYTGKDGWIDLDDDFRKREVTKMGNGAGDDFGKFPPKIEKSLMGTSGSGFGNWRIFVYWLKCEIVNLIFSENNAFPA